MFKIDGVKFNGVNLVYGVLDTKDSTVEYYTEAEIRTFVNSGFEIHGLDNIPKLRNMYNQKNFVLGNGNNVNDSLYAKISSAAFNIASRCDINYSRADIVKELFAKKLAFMSVADVDFVFSNVMHQSKYPVIEPLSDNVVAHLSSLTKGVNFKSIKDTRKLYQYSFYYLDKLVELKDIDMKIGSDRLDFSDLAKNIDSVAGKFAYMSCFRQAIQRHGSYQYALSTSTFFTYDDDGLMYLVNLETRFTDMVTSILEDNFRSSLVSRIKNMGYSVEVNGDKLFVSINADGYQSGYTIYLSNTGRYIINSTNTNFSLEGGVLAVIKVLSERSDYFMYRQDLSMKGCRFKSDISLDDKRRCLMNDFAWYGEKWMKSYCNGLGINVVSYLFDVDYNGMFCQVITTKLLNNDELSKLKSDISGQLSDGYGEGLDVSDIASGNLSIYQVKSKPLRAIGRCNYTPSQPLR